MLNLGNEFPNFKADTSIGPIEFHEWIGDSWAILFSHPADFTPVCTTELGRVANLIPEFEKRGVKVIALSCDSVESHKKWIQDIKTYAKHSGDGFPYPIIADENRELAVHLGMVDPLEKDKDGLPLTCRAVFVIGPGKKLRLSMLYPATTGRNFETVKCVLLEKCPEQAKEYMRRLEVTEKYIFLQRLQDTEGQTMDEKRCEDDM